MAPVNRVYPLAPGSLQWLQSGSANLALFLIVCQARIIKKRHPHVKQLIVLVEIIKEQPANSNWFLHMPRRLSAPAKPLGNAQGTGDAFITSLLFSYSLAPLA